MWLVVLLWGTIFEFGDWLMGGKGVLGKVILDVMSHDKQPVPFYFQNPFLSLYLILPAIACSNWIKEQIREILSLNPVCKITTHPSSERIAKYIQFFSVLIFLFSSVSIWKSIEPAIDKGSYLSSSLFSPGTHGLVFSMIIFNAAIFWLVLRNLPQATETNESILQPDVVGMRALNANQFALEIIIGHSNAPALISGPARIYKDKERRWYIFSEGQEVFGQQGINTEIGPLNIGYSYWVRVTENPKDIQRKEISLTNVESSLQLQNVIKRDVAREFERWIGGQTQYDELLKLTKDLFGDEEPASRVAYTIEQQLARASSANQIRYQLRTLQTSFQQDGQQDWPMFGDLFNVRFQITGIGFSNEWDQRLTKFEEEVKSSYETLKNEINDKREFGLKLVETFTTVIRETDGRVPREVVGETVQKLLGETINISSISQSFSGNPSPASLPIGLDNQNHILPPATQETALMPMSIDAIVRQVEPKLKQALATYSDTTEAIKSVLPAITISRKLEKDAKTEVFEEWSDAKIGKLKSGNAKDVLEIFLRELEQDGYVIGE